MFKVALVSDCAVIMAEELAKQNLLALVVGLSPDDSNIRGLKKTVIGHLKKWFEPHSSTKAVAKTYGIPYLHFPFTNQENLANWIKDADIDFLVTFSAPILEQPVIKAVKVAALNAHSALLPNYAGGNPFLWQVIDGADQIGITIHRLNEKVDEGSILFQKAIPMPVKQEKHSLIKVTDLLAAKGIHTIIEGYKNNGNLAELDVEPALGTKAPNLQRKNLKVRFDWMEGDVEVLFRIVKYLGKWPIEIAEPKGVYRFLPLKAVYYKKVDANETLGLEVSKSGLKYGVSSGFIMLQPIYNPIEILRHAKEARRIKRGELKEQYL
ncbi:formyltransferase family protein [Reinekea marina]|uniref:Formyltransferase family protein n=1 Tax=Reinekea marina TaxID=1310421 RepID=A0ABV7WT44_9GAMM|nr:formyltransferase family protein [Reinekea marina]MDN3648142.1 formyltransferase family protein [Reinekea marina]